VLSQRLKSCIKHLHRYRKRANACELVVNADRKHTVVQQSKLVSLLRKALTEERSKASTTTEAIVLERRERKLGDVKRAAEYEELRKLQARVAELEARGSSTIRGRDEAIAALDSKVKSAEDSMHKWFKVELPRLVSGLPVTEDYTEAVLSPFDFYNRGGKTGADAMMRDATSALRFTSAGLDSYGASAGIGLYGTSATGGLSGGSGGGRLAGINMYECMYMCG